MPPSRRRPDRENGRRLCVCLEHTLRQALTDGFTQAELERVKKELNSQLESAVLTAATRDSKEIAAKIIRHLNDNKVLQSPEQERALYGPIVNAMTLAEIKSLPPGSLEQSQPSVVGHRQYGHFLGVPPMPKSGRYMQDAIKEPIEASTAKNEGYLSLSESTGARREACGGYPLQGDRS